MSVHKVHEAITGISSNLVALPGSEEYNVISNSYLSALQSDLKPAAFALPGNKEDVVAILKALRPFKDDISLAVAGVGQQPAPGVANVDGGITIHMRNFKGIKLSADKTVVSIAPGETWGAVYEKLDTEGLSVSGCRASTGGIGGLAAQGGLSFFSSERGFIADDVVNYQIVLANGEVIDANEKEHSDLFIALKGGCGSNFGIITRFDFATFKQGKMWGGKFLYTPASFPGQLEALAEYLNGPNTDPKAQVRINIGYAAEFGGIMCMNDPTYTEPEKPTALSAFVDDVEPKIDAVNTLRVDSVKGMADEQSAQTTMNQRVMYMTTTLKATADILKLSLDDFYKTFDTIKDVSGLVYAATYEPYPTSLLEAGRNSLGLDPEDGPLVLLLLFASWKDPNDDETIIRETKANIDAINKKAKETGAGSAYIYMNYAYSSQDPITSYGSGQKKQLQDVSKKYDPEGLFQKAFHGGFKLF